MKQRTDSQGVPYSYLVDNIKVVLIFLVVFNHLIAFQLVKVDMVVRYVWYGITIFHMPAFIFISGYLSKKPQDVLKNVKNLLIPYILGYSLTWYAYIWTGRSMDYELLRPSGTVMWYVLALFIYRLTIEALGKIRFYRASEHYFLHCGQEQDRNLRLIFQAPGLLYFSVFLWQAICGRVITQTWSVNSRVNGSCSWFQPCFCMQFRIL